MESHHLHVSPSCESPLEHPPLHERGIPSFNKLEELFPGETMEHEEEDPNLQWLSIFVEDCLSSNPTPHLHLPPPQPPQKKVKATTNNNISSSIPVKQPRSKRRRTGSNLTYPSLLHQPHWLAESELLLPKERLPKSPPEPQHETGGASTLAPKRCSHCQSQKTPQWREGPEGPKTLCNACGVRFKKGRLLPEYRPAKSPTFQSCKHSNSHKKVMEMRMMAAAPLLSQGSTM